ncbi:MAG: hypothetical protein A2W72_11450 [Burkholderiales bacterium RIFCSPLOWO2_12_67_14]|nr:MAG: hypothetical protein A3I64_22615 [Burkholderiales bacterium RIFCSPLOWO2_02_FULL_67_64]OGB40297.1 MAG: hypothetical protein A2W72_11450 [Burkholderiales bacterium RIFCSPLOWO2_12_67_14]OGB48574.1 MAG: hypothetical protein A3E51_03810 [Burkholderiales bacterium RIFCSPHIGHO2_12_FULL_67_38]OGB95974.1 MAG: hypothetical protein A3G82_17375 [Burkholderiales bacterium RIFCSPLOWO2_12_FULL_67_210]
MNRQTSRLPILIAALVALAVAGYFGWRYFQPAPAPVAPAAAPSATAPEAPPAPAAPEPTPPAIQHPVEAPVADTAGEPAPLPALAESDEHVSTLLSDLLGRKNVLTFLQLDGFVRRAVATVDNLARSQAPVMVWPVNPTPQRFTTQRAENGVETIHPDNSQRYAPLVQMIESVDTAQAVNLYRSLYPLFQQAYEELGFPGRYFNDRLVEVLDHLIATPVPTGPLTVTLVEVKGSVPSTRPWVRYELADPALESQSAGRKMLLRTGPDHQRRLQAKLKDIRQRLTRP